MCGRFGFNISQEQLKDKYGIVLEVPATPRFNIAPSQPVLALTSNEFKKNTTQAKHLQWGLIPEWAEDPNIGFKMFNARRETIMQKASFKNAFRRRRCIVPVSGFYEWDRKQNPRQPYWFTLVNDQSMALAGIWEHWQNAQGTELETLSLITTGANMTVRPIHDRMPVILKQADFNTWLHTDETELKKVFPLLQTCPAQAIKKHPVSTKVNKTNTDGADLIQKIDIVGEQRYLF